MKLVKCFIFFAGIVMCSGQNIQTPCPEFFQYKYDQTERQYFGYLELPPPELGQNVKLNVNLQLRVTLPTKYYGTLEAVGTRESIIRDIIARRNVRYKIRFPLQNPLPRISSIIYDSKIICTGLQEFGGGIVTMIKLEHTLYTAAAGRALHAQLKQQQQQQSVSAKPVNVRKRVTSTSTTTEANYDDEYYDDLPESNEVRTQTTSEVCGKPVLTTPLIFGGDEASRGQFPWLAALYRKRKKGSTEFKCGATLVSRNAVITAAHCLKFDSHVMPVNEIVVILGKHNLDDFSETGSQTVYAKDIILHPDFMSKDTSFDADIAIILLKRHVQYSQYIRPLCIFSEVTKHHPGEKGTVIGWGKDHLEGTIKSYPSTIEMQLVSDATCLRAHESFQYITSSRTFCAGNANGTGPCSGDSGGPLMMKRRGKWFLKGIVSASPIDVETHSCDLKTYVVFTDVTKFLPWIKRHIRE
ncbi:serine protease gd-like [Culicoides brevitarsis]|uniref:serine protease gd-like n=1 Tax=Culicoides brevitarsis TaxID=469753 RepID=UPI00307C3C5F